MYYNILILFFFERNECKAEQATYILSNVQFEFMRGFEALEN